jgi:hypothetical protein
MDELTMMMVKDQWHNCNVTTQDFLANVPAERFRDLPFSPRFQRFNWEFACLLHARYSYIEAIRTQKSVCFEPQPAVIERDELLQWTKDQFEMPFLISGYDVAGEINRSSTTHTLQMVIQLLQHERIHHGKLILYSANIFLPIPDIVLETWGHTNFTPHADASH